MICGYGKARRKVFNTACEGAAACIQLHAGSLVIVTSRITYAVEGIIGSWDASETNTKDG